MTIINDTAVLDSQRHPCLRFLNKMTAPVTIRFASVSGSITFQPNAMS